MDSPGDNRHHQFLRLFTEHEPALRTYVRSLVPTRNDASEVMQEVAVVLWEKIGEFDESRDFRKWAFGVARFQALAFVRDRARDRHVFDEQLLERLAEEAVTAEPRHNAQRESLDTCLKRLPDRQRALVLSAYAPGTRMDQLAEKRGQTPMSLYKVLHRIRQALLDCVRREMARQEPA
jgi:RNA polymerase sigma-70 factor (ECF subfamily)